MTTASRAKVGTSEQVFAIAAADFFSNLAQNQPGFCSFAEITQDLTWPLRPK
jgi:hypothetical protein